MIFRGWQKTSLIEYPNKIATVLFTGGCNFRCPFCHNSELVLKPETFPHLDSEQVLAFLKENRNLYQAVVVTGGEPTITPGLVDFLELVKEAGFLTGLATNGTHPVLIERLIADRTVDYIAMDLKAPLEPEKYMTAAGLREATLFDRVLGSVRTLLASDIEYEFRTTVVPGLHDKRDIISIARSIEGAVRFVLQQFIPEKTLAAGFSDIRPYPRENFLQWKAEIEKNGGCCTIRF